MISAIVNVPTLMKLLNAVKPAVVLILSPETGS
jgi:hypothetical protein